MLKCNNCGQDITEGSKFCSNCGERIIWPDYNGDIEDKIDEFSDYIKEKGNEFLDDNLPEDYANKVRQNISNFQEASQDPERSFIDENEKLSNAKDNLLKTSNSIKQSGSNFIDENEKLSNAKDSVLTTASSFKESGENFINNNISQDTRDKFKSNFNDFSDSTKKFSSDASIVLKNIHSHRLKVKQKKKDEKDELKRQKEEELMEKQKLDAIEKEKIHQNKIIEIREKRVANIEIPVPKEQSNDAMRGAITGEMIGSGAGRVIGGIAGDSIIDTLDAGLILGGAGALIGGLAAAGDDGVNWLNSQIFISDEELIISGKFSLHFDEIKLISTSKFKSNDMIVFTLKNKGLDFKTDDAKALKIVIEEYMQKYFANKKKPSNVDELLKYGELFEKGVITKEELEEKKKELL